MTADDVRGEDYEAAKPVPTRSRVTGYPWVRDHLPECYFDAAKEQERQLCICPALRACEQRKDNEWASFARLDEERNIAYAAGVQAARDAVAAYLDAHVVDDAANGLLAAIDALKGEQA